MGLTDDNGQDEERINLRYIGQYVGSVSAVLIVVDRSSPNIRDNMVSMESALFTIVPKALVNNTALILTTFGDPVLWGPFQETVPTVLKDAPLFSLGIPIVLQKGLEGDRNVRGIVKPDDQRNLGMLVKLFDWLDGLEPQPATEIVCLHEMHQNIDVITTTILDARDQEVDRGVELDTLRTRHKNHSAVSLSLCLHLKFESYARWI